MWDAVSQQCVQSCSFRMTNATCTSSSMCIIGPGGSCSLTCSNKYTGEAQCTADSQCYWDTVRSSCGPACNSIVSQAQCGAAATCQFSSGSCSLQCSYKYANASNCNDDMYCMYNNATGGCENTCRKAVTSETSQAQAAECNAAPMCTYNTSTRICVPDCGQLTTQPLCIGNSRCLWDPQSAYCKPVCNRLTSATDCGTQPTFCWWDATSSICNLQCKFAYTNAATCSADSNCQWDITNRYCKASCKRATTSASCTSNVECEWDSNKCVPLCCQFSVDSCVASGNERCIVYTAGFMGDVSFQGKICAKTCPFTYSQQPSCNNDVNCMWNVAAGQCQESCGRVAYEAGTAAEAACNGTALCQYSMTLGCTMTCNAAYSDESSCNGNVECQWDNLRNKCGQRCGLLPTLASCTSNPMCQFLPNGTCLTQCAYRYATPRRCTADSSCVWNTAAGQCMSGCSQTTQGTCGTDTSCTCNNGTCNPRCDTSCVSKTCCAQNPTCMFDINAGSCQTTCTQRDQVACAAASGMCTITAAGSCVQLCQVRFPNASPTSLPAVCNNDTECMYDASATQCKQTCSFYTNLQDCATQAMCKWDNTSSLCTKQCAFDLSEPVCTADPTCEWSRSALSCNQKCVFRYTSASACNANPGCMWDNTALQCTSNCQRLSPNQCAQQAMCFFDVKANPPCELTCSNAHTSPVACMADTNCFWDVEHLSCNQLCRTIQTSGYSYGRTMPADRVKPVPSELYGPMVLLCHRLYETI